VCSGVEESLRSGFSVLSVFRCSGVTAHGKYNEFNTLFSSVVDQTSSNFELRHVAKKAMGELSIVFESFLYISYRSHSRCLFFWPSSSSGTTRQRMECLQPTRPLATHTDIRRRSPSTSRLPRCSTLTESCSPSARRPCHRGQL